LTLIPGANSGIGYETALRAASSSKYHVIMGSRSTSLGEKALEAIKSATKSSNLSLQQLDITDDSSIAAAVSATEKQFGRLDVLINNAGVYSAAKTHAERLRQNIGVNAIGTALVTEAFTPLLLKSSDPRIVYISSILGSITEMAEDGRFAKVPDAESYRVSKAAMNMVAMCDHVNLKDKGVKVHVICPGYVMSNLGCNSEEDRAKRLATNPGDPKDSAETIMGAVEGKRDEYVARWFDKEGTIPW
jgi:NAD(P)-dependent dehydrogenase (short-subunit alcohol dehydrogenase family)